MFDAEGRSLPWRRLWMDCRRWVLGVGLASLALPGAAGSSVHAADHGLALVYPVDGSRITIDGDLSDWPDGLPRYGIEGRFLPVPAAGTGSRFASFQLGYSATRLEACFVELDQGGETQRRVATHLRRLVQAGDLEGVVNFVKEVRHE